MSKLCFVVLFVAFVGAASAATPLDVISGALKTVNQIRNTVFCLAHSCDPNAIEKVLLIHDVAEFELKQRSIKSETKADRVMKLAAVVSEALKKYLAIDPNCKNPSYTCPTLHTVSMPQELIVYENVMGSIVALANCISVADVPDVITIISDVVEYIENNRDTSGNSFSRVVPAVEIAARGLKNICDRRQQFQQTIVQH
ncbi:uncharacterized protein [Musca autumnalis]|uniref:uncharacterized protein n=1 Tax=Musca autumnalis TaxID=221902 RepID=UPI003CEEF69E